MNDEHGAEPGELAESGTVIDPDVRALRVMAHPMRLRLLGLLRQDGPCTATRLAQRCGINSGSASYHLRQLAGAGLIAEETGRGTGRDRWWRATHVSVTYDLAPSTGERLEAGEAYLRTVAALHADGLARAAAEIPLLPLPWRQASTMSDYVLRLTAEELEALNDEVEAVVARYRGRHTGDAGASAPVVLIHAGFPAPGAVAVSVDDGERP